MNDKGIISFGQHYLQNEEIQDVLVASANLNKNDKVIEVGAGDGRITKKIAQKAGRVVAYEIDEKTKSDLNALCKNYKNVEIVFDNFLKVDFFDANKLVSSLQILCFLDHNNLP